MAKTKEGVFVGVPEIDSEHGLQLSLIRDLEVSVESADSKRALALLQQLEDVTNAHFLAEQLLMRRHAYPSYQAHQQEHDRLIAELRELKASLTHTERPAPLDAGAIELWLLRHIQTSDRALAAFLAQSKTTP